MYVYVCESIPFGMATRERVIGPRSEYLVATSVISCMLHNHTIIFSWGWRKYIPLYFTRTCMVQMMCLELWQQGPESLDIVDRICYWYMVSIHDSVQWLNNTFFGSLSPGMYCYNCPSHHIVGILFRDNNIF